MTPTETPMPEPLLDIKNLCIDFQTEMGTVRAVDDISFTVHRGEIVGLVGESGAGKSLTSEAILRLIRCPPGILSGEIFYQGIDLLTLKDADLAKMRGKDIAMIFQNPISSLNPVFRIGAQLLEAMQLHLSESKNQLKQQVVSILQRVGIPSAEQRVKDYPHQFSGGMSQRSMIGMGIACAPSLLIADEPTTALDVTIQAQILSLIRRLSRETNTAILLVSHDLGIISQMCSRVLVMYAGKIVEEAPISTVFHAPAHPYTRGLMASIPQMDQQAEQLESIPGTMPGLHDIPSGCRFHPRCVWRDQTCVDIEPQLRQIDPQHWAACHKADGPKG